MEFFYIIKINLNNQVAFNTSALKNIPKSLNILIDYSENALFNKQPGVKRDRDIQKQKYWTVKNIF